MIDKFDLCNKALSLRKEFGQDVVSSVDVFSLTHIITNLTLVFYPMGEKLSGICVKNDGNSVIAINSSMSLGRQRFSMAHELYHLYFDETKDIIASTRKIGVGSDIEKSADQFASYFLMPPIALAEALRKFHIEPNAEFSVKEIVKLEQYFGISRQALLCRLLDDKKISLKKADKFRQGVINSALNLGYDDTLYRPLPENKQYKTYGYYIVKAQESLEKGLVSNGKYEQLLLSAFRADLVYGDEYEEGELND